MASYEASAKDFLYPYSWDRLEYTGLRRYVLLNRTVEFPGISPSFEFSTSPSVDDVTGLPLPSTTYRRQTKTVRFASLFLRKIYFALLCCRLDEQNRQRCDHRLLSRIGMYFT